MTLHCAGCGGELEGKAHFSDGDDRSLWLWCPDCDQSGDFAAGDVRHLDDGHGIATDGGANVGDADILHYKCQNDECGREFDLPEYDYCPYCGSVEFEPVRAATDGGEVTDATSQKVESFPFEEGDTVTVRAREHGDSGPIQAKFTAECRDISGRRGPSDPVARFGMPFGTMNSVTIAPYEAEFEVQEGDSNE